MLAVGQLATKLIVLFIISKGRITNSYMIWSSLAVNQKLFDQARVEIHQKHKLVFSDYLGSRKDSCFAKGVMRQSVANCPVSLNKVLLGKSSTEKYKSHTRSSIINADEEEVCKRSTSSTYLLHTAVRVSQKQNVRLLH